MLVVEPVVLAAPPAMEARVCRATAPWQLPHAREGGSTRREQLWAKPSAQGEAQGWRRRAAQSSRIAQGAHPAPPATWRPRLSNR